MSHYLDNDGLARVWAKVKALVSTSNLIDTFYPVGSYYETTDTTFNPNTAWGGTWVLEDEGLVHISSGENYTVSSNSKDGGHDYVYYTPQGTNEGTVLEIRHMPNHGHTLQFYRNGQYFDAIWYAGYGAGTARGGINYNETSAGAQPYISKTGGNQAHSHTFTGTQSTIDVRQSYKVVNRWHRTA